MTFNRRTEYPREHQPHCLVNLEWEGCDCYPVEVSTEDILREIVEAWDANALIGPRQLDRFKEAIERGRERLSNGL